MGRIATRRTVDDFATQLRQVLGSDDSYESFLHVEATAMDKVEFAADPQGDSDADRIAEVRDIIAALRLVRAERRARLGR